MSELGELIAAIFSRDEQKKTVDKEPLKIHFAIFFDGTMNNRTNIEERENAELGTTSESYKKSGDGGSNSYDNGRTNIEIMEPHVPIKKNGKDYDYSFKLYVEGQGTFNKKSDSMYGYAMGAGDSGVESRARQGIERAMDNLKDYLEAYPPEKYFIEKVVVDVFGFSRGAATARHCIFLLTDEDGDPLHEQLVTEGYEETVADSVKVRFAGLYDTVVSVLASQKNPWSDNRLQQRAVARAEQAVHLAAAEEHRKDFPLHKITSALNANKGKEYYLPGVHSDVGGSYNLANKTLLEQNAKGPSTIKIVLSAGDIEEIEAQKQQLINDKVFTADKLVIEVTDYYAASRPQRRKGKVNGKPKKGKLIELRTLSKAENMRTSGEIGIEINKGNLKKLAEDRKWLIEQGWYKDDEINIDVIRQQHGRNPSYGKLVVNRPNIKSAYSNIPLKIMAKFARENKITIDAKLESDADAILSKEPDLLSLEAEIESYIQAKGDKGSKPEDWIADKTEKLKRIRNEHLHMSAKLGIGYSPNFKDGKRKRRYYEG